MSQLSIAAQRPIEEQRFQAYLQRPGCPGTIVHLPSGDQSCIILTTAPSSPLLFSYIIYLPFRWHDTRRIYEVAMYIAYIECSHWQRSALDQLMIPRQLQQADRQLLEEIADRLVAPRPWAQAMVQRHGSNRPALQQAAHSISIPWTSIRTVLQAPPSPAADSVHRHLHATIGHPWFLPEELWDDYPNDIW
jgi:hypothetical protein